MKLNRKVNSQVFVLRIKIRFSVYNSVIKAIINPPLKSITNVSHLARDKYFKNNLMDGTFSD